MEQTPSWEANRLSPSQEIPLILWNPKVHGRIYRCLPPVPILSQINPVHAPHPTSWRSFLILSPTMPRSPYQNPVCTSPLTNTCHITSPSHSSWFDHPSNIWWAVENTKLPTICTFPHFPFTSPLLGPNILLSTLLSNALCLRSSLNVRDQASHPYKTTGKITVLCILIFILRDSKLEDKRFCTKRQQALTDYNLPLISSQMEFPFVRTVPKYLNCFTLSKDLLLLVAISCRMLVLRPVHILIFLSIYF